MGTATNYYALLFRKYLNNKWIFQNNSFSDLNLPARPPPLVTESNPS